MKVLIILTYPIEDPASRFRILQYIPDLKARKFKVKVDTIFPSFFYKIKNHKGIFWGITIVLLMMLFLLLRLIRIPRAIIYDVVVIHREAFPFLTPMVENIVRKLSRKVIFDFDDAIFTKPTGHKNWRDYLRNPENVMKIFKLSDTILAGNDFLKEQAQIHSSKVITLPTVYKISNQLKVKDPSKKLTIGWVGSWTTLQYLEIMKPILRELSKEHEFNFRIIGANNIREYKVEGLNIEYVLWNLHDEGINLDSIDIGIMPLYDNEWEKGKCGFKIIQYMSLGKPVVASPVGANLNIIKHSYNGFLADTRKEWVYYLSFLLKNREKREEMGKNASLFVQQHFSYHDNLSKIIEVLKTNEQN